MPWVRLLASDALARGGIEPVREGGLELVVWRDLGGTAHVHDARCPHQFNHLAAVGGVDGCELVCTAHFWRFDVAGTGTRLLADGTREPMRDLPAYAVREDDGWITAELPG
jgi:nitrite reductase/ring-hydroxylating ferredoxin subunit